jgi:hypothetical protein
MFERFTDQARHVVVLAQEEARLLAHDYIGTEHILLGLLRGDEGVAAMALQSMDVSLGPARAEVEALVGHGGTAPSGHIPFTPRAKKVLEMSLREALQLGHDHIGTEHILLGLVREGQGVAAEVLVKLGADPASVRQVVTSLLEGSPLPATVHPLAEMVRTPRLPWTVQSTSGRCSFCLRSEERVSRMVRGPAGLICDECLVRASALVAEAGDDSPHRLRLRRAALPTADLEDTVVLVERAFETVFGSGASVDRRLALIEDSADLSPVVERMVALARASGELDVWVDVVRLLSADEAEVHWSPLLAGGGRISMHGFAVLDGGLWKVSRTSYHQVASIAGVPFPTGAGTGGDDPAAEGPPA